MRLKKVSLDDLVGFLKGSIPDEKLSLRQALGDEDADSWGGIDGEDEGYWSSPSGASGLSRASTVTADSSFLEPFDITAQRQARMSTSMQEMINRLVHGVYRHQRQRPSYIQGSRFTFRYGIFSYIHGQSHAYACSFT